MPTRFTQLFASCYNTKQLRGRRLFRREKTLGPLIPLLRKRQRSNALTSDAENGAAYRRQNRRQRRLAKPRRWIFRRQEMNVDFRRHLIHAQRRVLVEIALHGAAAFNGDFVAHQMAQALDHRAADFVQRAGGIDDLAPDVACDPYLVYLETIAGENPHLSDLREI